MAPRSRHRLPHRIRRDLVEDDPVHRPLADGAAHTQPGQDLPGDRLAFAVGFGGEDQAVSRLERRRNRPQRPDGPLAGLRVGHGEVVVGIDRARLRRQIEDMAVAGAHMVAAAEPGPDRPCLGGRFDDRHMHEPTSGARPSSRSRAGAGHGTGRRVRHRGGRCAGHAPWRRPRPPAGFPAPGFAPSRRPAGELR